MVFLFLPEVHFHRNHFSIVVLFFVTIFVWPFSTLRALVYDNLVEDNARAGIFFHRSTDYAEAYGNTCRRNLEGDFGIVECTGVTVHDNVMEVSRPDPSGSQRGL